MHRKTPYSYIINLVEKETVFNNQITNLQNTN